MYLPQIKYKMRNLEIRIYKSFKIDGEDTPAAQWCFCDQTGTVYFVSGHRVWKQCLEDGQSAELLTE